MKYIYLGNTRATFSASGQNLVVNDISHFDPTGIPLNGTGIENAIENRFKHQSKESLALFGLSGVNDFLARYADKTINRFWGVDALSDQMVFHSPYSISFNNPLSFIDPDGNEGEEAQKNDGFMYSDGYTTWDSRFSTGSISFSGHYESSDPPKKLTTTQRVASFSVGVLNTVGAVGSAAYIVGTDGVGWIAGGYAGLAYNLDHATTNFTEAWTGEAQETLGSKLLQTAGVPQNTANNTYAAAGLLMMKPAGAAGVYSATSTAVRTAVAEKVGKRGFTEVGYQFQKHYGRGGFWGDVIPLGSKLNPTTFNQAGYSTFKEIWRAPGSFQNVGGFLEKRLIDGRGIRLQQNFKFKGFLD